MLPYFLPIAYSIVVLRMDVCVRIDIAEVRNYDLQNLSFASPGDTLDVQDLALLLEGETTSRVCLMPMSFGGSLMAEEPVYILENKSPASP